MKSRILIAPTLGAALIMWCGTGLAQDSANPNQPGQSATQSSSQQGSSSQKSSKLSMKGKHFMRKAAQGGIEEVELGQMMSQKAKSDAVKQFAQMMVQDHTKANDQLKSLAQQKGVTLPTEMDAKGKELKAKLEKLSGDNLDKAYMSSMVKDHTKDVNEFKQQSTSAQDSDLKEFASQALPTLQQHLQKAKEVAGQVGASQSGTQTAQQ